MATSSELRTVEPAAEGVAAELPSSQGDGSLARGVVRSTALAIPLFVVVFGGLTALAAAIAQIGYGTPVAMGAGVGVLAGIFWGGWMGFLAFSRADVASGRK